MASLAHCFYCFECISASFAGGEPPKLSVLEDLWDEYEAARDRDLEPDDDDVDEAEEDDEDSSSEVDDGPANASLEAPTRTPLRPGNLKLRSISRLQEDVSAPSSSESSNSTTPSALSTSSSRSVLTNATSISVADTPVPRSSTSISPSSGSGSVSGSRSRYLKSSAGSTFPLFVTWNTVSRSGHKSLRGCIGTFEALELEEGLRTYAMTSAFGDTRFSPIPAHLLPSLSCSLTLLSSFEPCSHPLDWDLGTHGIRISFVHRGRRHGATYLPDVAVEQGWSKEETVESLMRKAGWDGRAGGGRRFLQSAASNVEKPWERVADFKTVRYQGLKASAGYAEWQEWRRWVEKTVGRDVLG